MLKNSNGDLAPVVMKSIIKVLMTMERNVMMVRCNSATSILVH